MGYDNFTFNAVGTLSQGNIFTLFDGSSPIVGTLGADNSGPIGAGLFAQLLISGDGNDLLLEVIPEPGSATILLAGLGSLLAVRRRRA